MTPDTTALLPTDDAPLQLGQFRLNRTGLAVMGRPPYDDAVLFLWVTSPKLVDCWPVISAWGFTYKTSMVWNKVAHNYGNYVSVRHEFLLICTRESCTPDAPVPMPNSVVTERRSETHSEKPASFRTTIERLYPLGRRLELFGRRAVEGWTVYGNQLQPVACG